MRDSLIALAVFLFVTAPAGTSQGRVTHLAAAASAGNVEDFAKALVASGAPVGVVVLKSDAAQRPPSWQGPFTPVPGELNEALATFRARRPDYKVDIEPDGALVIGPATGGGCLQSLRSRRRSLTTSGPAFEVLYRIYRQWTDATGPYIPPALLGARAEADTGRVAAFNRIVSLDLKNATAVEALAAVVRQAPGIGWSVRQLPVTAQADGQTAASSFGCNVSLFDASARLATSWTITVSGSVPR